jgi:hypothetical protein
MAPPMLHLTTPVQTPRWYIACLSHASFEAFTAEMFQVEVFWVVTPCSEFCGRIPTFWMSVLFPSSGWSDLMFSQRWRFKSWSSGLWRHLVVCRWSHHGHPKRWYPTTTLTTRRHNPEYLDLISS